MISAYFVPLYSTTSMPIRIFLFLQCQTHHRAFTGGEVGRKVEFAVAIKVLALMRIKELTVGCLGAATELPAVRIVAVYRLRHRPWRKCRQQFIGEAGIELLEPTVV